MALSDNMEKRMNDILVNAQEMLAEIDAEVGKLNTEIEELKKKRGSVENLRKDALMALGITEQESGVASAALESDDSQSFDLDSQFDQ